MLDFSNIVNQWGVPLVVLVLTGMTVWLMGRTSTWLNAHAAFLDASQRAKILAIEKDALDEASDIIVQTIRREGTSAKVDVNNPLIRWGVQIALNHAAGTLAANGASPDELAAKILSRLPQQWVQDGTTSAAKLAGVVTPEPMAPLKTKF